VLELDDEAAARRLVQQRVERPLGIAQVTPHGDRNVAGLADVTSNLLPQIAAKIAQMTPVRAIFYFEKVGGVCARLHHHAVALGDEKERAMRLDGASELNLLALTIGEVRGSKRRTLRLFSGQIDGPPRGGHQRFRRRLFRIEIVFPQFGMQALPTQSQIFRRAGPIALETLERGEDRSAL